VILGTVGLLAGFILVLFLLAIVLIRSHTAVVTKFILVVLISSFYWVQYQSLLQYRGWPTTDQLPDEFILIASEVQEPDPRRGIEGGMYWWVRESDNLQQPPRVYQLPYQEEIHQQADNVIKEQEQGAQYVGRRGEAGAQSGGFGVSFERISKSSRYKKQ
jgi:hypothetical protein